MSGGSTLLGHLGNTLDGLGNRRAGRALLVNGLGNFVDHPDGFARPFANFADQVALMVDGRLVKLGSPAEVLQPEILSGVYHLPLTTVQDPFTGHFAVLPR